MSGRGEQDIRETVLEDVKKEPQFLKDACLVGFFTALSTSAENEAAQTRVRISMQLLWCVRLVFVCLLFRIEESSRLRSSNKSAAHLTCVRFVGRRVLTAMRVSISELQEP